MKKSFFLLLLAALLMLCGCVKESPEPIYVPPEVRPEDRVQTHGEELEGIYYQFFNDKTCHVAEVMTDKITTSALVIPESVDGYTVVAVENEVFRDSVFVSVTLPDTVKRLGEGAFRGSAIQEMKLPSSLEEMGAECFDNCLKLKKVTFSASLKEIPLAAFYGCSSLGEVILPEGVEAIGEEAFASLTALRKVSLPSTLKEIGDYAFWNSGVETLVVSVPSSVEKVGEEAFGGFDSERIVYQGDEK